MSVQIRFEKSLTDEEWQTLFEWDKNIFGVEDMLYRWRPKDWHFIVEAKGRVVSHVGVLQTTVRAGEHAVLVAGIGGVVSVPEAQGRGHAQSAMRRAVEFMRDELQVEFGMLFCLPRLAPFYARQGWQLLEETVEFEQPSGPIPSPFCVMVLPFGGREWPAGKTLLGGLPW
ncbi:MAG: GNAT family N-acetyltransferase [Pyrinomonadaceae bacterium]